MSRNDGSDGHDQVSKKLDQQTQRPRNAKVDEVAKMYERQFLGEMFKAMRSTVNETEKPSMAQSIYQSQRDEQYLDAWSERGGIGFSNIIYDQIMEKFFGQTPQGVSLKKQGMVALTNREVASVSKVVNGVATPVVPSSAPSVAPKAAAVVATASLPAKKSFENTEPMAAPTSPSKDSRSIEERVAAGEHFPESAVVQPKPELNVDENQEIPSSAMTTSQTALKIEVRPSPSAGPAKIQAPWDATVIRSAKLDGARTAVVLEHGPGVRSTLVFDGVLGANVQPGEKIPRGQTVGTLNADAKSFLWNLATTGQD